MKCYSLAHLSNDALLHGLAALVAQDRTITGELLAHIAEVDARQLYRPAAYSSMYAYCVGELHLSEDAAAKRIQVARAARRFPGIFESVADGRLHLTGANLLAPHLTEDTAQELLSAAAHKTKAEIERLLAARFPRPDVLAWVEPIPMVAQASTEHAPAHVEEPGEASPQHAPAHVELARGQAPAPTPVCERARVKPLAPQRFALRCTIDQETHDALRYAQELLGHQLPSGVELDHIDEVARGGESTAANLRLRCRAHNQLQAECSFGAEFMRHKRIAAAEARAEAKAHTSAAGP